MSLKTNDEVFIDFARIYFKISNEFIRCFHHFVSPIFSMNFSQFEQLKKKTNSLLVQNSFFLSLPVEKEISTNICKKIVDSEFEIIETIGWIGYSSRFYNWHNSVEKKRRQIESFVMQQESNYKFTVLNNLDLDIHYLFISMCIQLDLKKNAF